MVRYKAEIEYDGTNFLGWQKQPEGLTVQGIIEDAIFGFSREKIEVFGAGRTDAGVHAYAQVAHFDIDTEMSEYKLQEAINAHLKKLKAKVAILSVEKVPFDFDARFSAKKRTYVYKIINRRAHSPLLYSFAWHVRKKLDVDKMIEASKHLLGTHDFTSFRAVACQANSPIRTIDNIEIIKKDDEILFYFEAKSFLYHQVRNIVGSLKMVGSGDFSSLDIKHILEAKDRTKAGVTAPAQGLYMKKIYY